MRYRMIYLGRDQRGRSRWRGTGFNLSPGGLTELMDCGPWWRLWRKFPFAY